MAFKCDWKDSRQAFELRGEAIVHLGSSSYAACSNEVVPILSIVAASELCLEADADFVVAQACDHTVAAQHWRLHPPH